MAGSVAGAFASFMTTPLDVAKTRLMLGKDAHGVDYKGTIDALVRVYYEGGSKPNSGSLRLLFSGVGPRVMWISIGGFVFFGSYEQCKMTFTSMLK